jgi:predicted Zn-dependent protease
MVALAQACATAQSKPAATADSPRASAPKRLAPKPTPISKKSPMQRRVSAEAYRAFVEGELLLQEGKKEEAAARWREALVHDPDSVFIRIELAQLYQKLGELDLARKVLTRARNISPGQAEASTMLAEIASLQGDDERARKILEETHAQVPENRGVAMRLARLYLKANDDDAAEKLLDALPTGKGEDSSAYLLARLYADRGDAKKALKALNHLDDDATRDSRVIALRVNLHWALGEDKEGLRVFNDAFSVVRRERLLLMEGVTAAALAGDAKTMRRWMALVVEDSTGDEGLLELANALERGGRWSEAVAVLAESKGTPLARLGRAQLNLALRRFPAARKDACNLNGGGPTAQWRSYGRVLCATTHTRLGEFEKALTALNEGLKEDPTAWRLVSALATLAEADPGPRAKEALRATLDQVSPLASDNADLLRAVHRATTVLDGPLAARRFLNKALARTPQDADLLMVYAEALLDEGEAHGAADVIEGLVGRSTQVDVDLFNLFAYALAEAGARLSEAEIRARQALVRRPLSPAIIDTLGWIQHRSGDFESARRTLQRAVRLAPHEPEILYHLAEATAGTGQHRKAMDLAKEALRMDNARGRVSDRLWGLIRRLEGKT